jgi:hypothetical protein
MNEQKITGPELGIMLMEFIATLDVPITGVLAALSFVTGTIACEAGYSKEDSVQAFGDSYEQAKLRLEKLKMELN